MNTRYFTKKIRTSSGFILVEAIVAIAIMALAIPAALTVASRSIALASYSRDQIIATYLAQEGLEIIRNKRDQNMLKIAVGDLSAQWTDGFWTGDCKAGLKCRVDYGVGVPEPLIQKCTSAPCSLVLNRSPDGTYSYATAGTPTPFSRYVQTDNVPCVGGGPPSPGEICVTSVVTYNSRGVNKTITLTENLTKWIR